MRISTHKRSILYKHYPLFKIYKYQISIYNTHKIQISEKGPIYTTLKFINFK